MIPSFVRGHRDRPAASSERRSRPSNHIETARPGRAAMGVGDRLLLAWPDLRDVEYEGLLATGALGRLGGSGGAD